MLRPGNTGLDHIQTLRDAFRQPELHRFSALRRRQFSAHASLMTARWHLSGLPA